MQDLRRIGVLSLLCALCAGLAFSQAVNGTIVGTVTDASGAAVANAKITLTETNTRIARNRLANESGIFGFPDLPPGTYEVAVEMPGFKKEVRSGRDSGGEHQSSRGGTTGARRIEPNRRSHCQFGRPPDGAPPIPGVPWTR